MTRAERYAEAKRLRAKGLTQKEIATRLGVSRSYVGDILADPDDTRRATARREAAHAEQFTRDLRGDHDGPRSYWLPPADGTPSAAEVLSWEG